VIARRYARALLELSLKENAGEAVKREMTALGGLMRREKYRGFFTDRLVPAAEKLEAAGSLSPLMRDFLRLVIANKREEYLYLISREYVELLNERNNVVDAYVSSSLPLTGEQKAKLSGKLEKFLGKKVNAAFRIDRKLIGGVKIRYGSSVIDGTIPGMLNGLLARLTGK
jgi:F-type H+-transporting ATPase subunit delta